MALLCGLCEVLFDVDAGNQVQQCVPAGAFSEAELADIAFSAFPDSLSMELSSRSSVRDSCFAFRLRRRHTPGSAGGGAGAAAPPAVYGHVFCRQRHDARLRRGCEQKSVVLLSHLPLPGLLEQLTRLVGPAALSAREQCADVLQQVYEDMQQWPPLEWGARLDRTLPGLPLPLSVQLPMLTVLPASALPFAVAASLERGHAEQAAAAGGVAAAPAQVAAALADELDGSGLPLCLLPQAWGQQELEASPFGDCDAWTPLRAVLPQLWALWELLLLGEPLMVVSPSPGACSGAVAALLSLLAPFPYSLDFRPYFTIHDAAFARLAAGELPSPTNALPLLMGITNLYLIKALPSWPNVLSTGFTPASLAPSASSDHLDASEAATAGSGNGGSSHGGSAGGGGLQPSESGSSLASAGGGGGGGKAPSAAGAWLGGKLRRAPTSPAALLSGPVDHCWLQYKPCCRADQAVLDRLATPPATAPAERWRRAAALNSNILRRHFQELTKALLFPLLPFLTPAQPPAPMAGHSTDPRAAEAAASTSAPPLPAWDPAAVLEQLSGREVVLPDILLQRFGGQKELLKFYARFLRSPAMAAFMHTRRLAAEEWQRQEWAAAGAAAAAPMRELLSVEAFFRVEQQLSAARVQLSTAGGGAEAEASALAAVLEEQLRLAFGQLPSDLQQAILATPCHAELLGGGVAAAGPADGQGQQQQQQQPEGAAVAAAAAAAAGEPATGDEAAAGEERQPTSAERVAAV